MKIQSPEVYSIRLLGCQNKLGMRGCKEYSWRSVKKVHRHLWIPN